MSRRSGRGRVYNDTGNVRDESVYGLKEGGQLDGEDLEITRCICGFDELNPASAKSTLKEDLSREYKIKIDLGLFIQCDQCLVWQHGYCVGLFIDDDVPDKYWCEMCKPDLHVLLYEGGDVVRSLYKPANESRQKLLLLDLAAGQSLTSFPKPTRPRGGKRTSSNQHSLSQDKGTAEQNEISKPNSRKERRHYEETYDEQLKKALRLSAKESGLGATSEAGYSKPTSGTSLTSISDKSINVGNASSKRTLTNGDQIDVKGNIVPVHTPESASEVESEKNAAEKSTTHPKSELSKRTAPRVGQSGRPKRSRNSNANSAEVMKIKRDVPQSPSLSKDDLINQPSKTRYVSERLSMYELRKRTGAILEWLGQRQLADEEEQSARLAKFCMVQDDVDGNVREQFAGIEKTSNENLQLVAALTERILAWEEKYGSYEA